VFFAFSVFFLPILLFDFKKIIGAVIIENLIISLSHAVAVFVDFGLDKITFLSENIQSTIHIVKPIGWFF
jgi:peroxiredoxin family protein